MSLRLGGGRRFMVHLLPRVFFSPTASMVRLRLDCAFCRISFMTASWSSVLCVFLLHRLQTPCGFFWRYSLIRWFNSTTDGLSTVNDLRRLVLIASIFSILDSCRGVGRPSWDLGALENNAPHELRNQSISLGIHDANI